MKLSSTELIEIISEARNNCINVGYEIRDN